MKRIASFVVIWHDFTIIFHAASLFIILNQETPVVAMPISDSHVERNILLLALSQLNVIVVLREKVKKSNSGNGHLQQIMLNQKISKVILIALARTLFSGRSQNSDLKSH
jgi:hypothetical protein